MLTLIFVSMAGTVEKLLNDANTLLPRLKDDDYTAEQLIGSIMLNKMNLNFRCYCSVLVKKHL